MCVHTYKRSTERSAYIQNTFKYFMNIVIFHQTIYRIVSIFYIEMSYTNIYRL